MLLPDDASILSQMAGVELLFAAVRTLHFVDEGALQPFHETQRFGLNCRQQCGIFQGKVAHRPFVLPPSIWEWKLVQSGLEARPLWIERAR